MWALCQLPGAVTPACSLQDPPLPCLALQLLRSPGEQWREIPRCGSASSISTAGESGVCQGHTGLCGWGQGHLHYERGLPVESLLYPLHFGVPPVSQPQMVMKCLAG